MTMVFLITGLLFFVLSGAAMPSVTGKSPSKSFKKALDFAFVDIPAGSFWMGDDENGPIHLVTLTQGFSIQTNEVTQAQWVDVMGSNPSENKNCKYCPVDSVTWNEVQDFIARLNTYGDGTYRLPTEAEWEYAARAGTVTKYSFGSGVGIDDYSWYLGNDTHEAATKKPNQWGLYDMHGNVSEWTADWYGEYPTVSVIDPKGPGYGTSKVYRGGGMGFDVNELSSAFRGHDSPEMRCSWSGFRLVLEKNKMAAPNVERGRVNVVGGTGFYADQNFGRRIGVIGEGETVEILLRIRDGADPREETCMVKYKGTVGFVQCYILDLD